MDNFNFFAKVQGTGTVFFTADIENAAKLLAADLAKAGEIAAEHRTLIEYENAEMNMSAKTLSFDIQVRSPLYKEIDPVELKARLAGVSKDEAKLSLSQNPNLQKAEIVLFPFWLERIPQDPSKVDITVVIDPVRD